MFQRILAPLDGSEFAEKSLPYVESLAQQYNAEVILGWVIQLRTYTVADFQPIDYGMVALLDTTAEKDRATTYLQRIYSHFQHRQIRVSYRIVESYSIADAIVSMAFDVKADLIVKTTYARLGPSRWLNGNVAALVMQRAPCPLFLVRVKGDERPDLLPNSAETPVAQP
jgi:nucleotide-binding universal stress UspA family protein